jgi:tetratricopeptide (TPR) repeat protein
MATNRLEILRQMLEQDPKNSFARYGLAMEYAAAGTLEQAVAEYQTLIGNDPGYVAAYFHGGQALEKLGKLEEARAIYVHGLAAASAKGDGHTRSEIQAALDLLPV